MSAEPYQLVPLADLVLDGHNVRLHGEADLPALQASLTEFGQRRPLVVQRGTNRVLSGNGLLQAARRIGLTELLVQYVDDDDSTAQRWALVDNRTGQLAPWDDAALSDALLRLSHDGALGDGLPGFDAREVAELLSLAELPHDALHDDGAEPVMLTPPPTPRLAPSAVEPPAPRAAVPAPPERAPGNVGVSFELSPAGYDEFTRLIRGAMERHRTVDTASTILAVLRAAAAGA